VTSGKDNNNLSCLCWNTKSVQNVRLSQLSENSKHFYLRRFKVPHQLLSRQQEHKQVVANNYFDSSSSLIFISAIRNR
jgi:hypothetical protein